MCNRSCSRAFFFSLLLGLAGLPSLASARFWTLGVSQDVGYETKIQTDDGWVDDGYTETTLRLGIDHPVRVFEDVLELDPTLQVSYLNYFSTAELSELTFDIGMPLKLTLSPSSHDSLTLTATARRELGDVSVVDNNEQQTSTVLDITALYRRERIFRHPRLKLELGYGYEHTFYDASQYRYLDRDDHLFSVALLYAFNTAVEGGLRTSYKREIYAESIQSDSDTWQVDGLVRWRLTGRIEAQVSAGYETVTYADGGSDGGPIFAAQIDYRPQERWLFSLSGSHELDAGVAAGEGDARTSKAVFNAAYQLSPQMTLRAMTGFEDQDAETRVTNYTFGAGLTYAFKLFDLNLSGEIEDRQSTLGGDDSYVSSNVRAGISFDF